MVRTFCAGINFPPPTLVVVAVMAAPKGLGPSPSALMLTKSEAGPTPPVGVSHTCTTAPPGEMATSPKLQFAVPGISCSALNAPTLATPRPVTAAPRVTICPP